MTATPLLPWAILDKEGVAAAHCTCMAGYINYYMIWNNHYILELVKHALILLPYYHVLSKLMRLEMNLD